MKTEIIANDGNAVVKMDGRLDTMTAPAFQNVLVQAIRDYDGVALDFSMVAYVSSAGLRTLLIGQKMANAANKKMKLTKVPQGVKEVLKMTGFINILTVE